MFGLKLFRSKETKSSPILACFSCNRLLKHVSDGDALYSEMSIDTALANQKGEHHVITEGVVL